MTSKKMALNVWNVYGDSVVLILMLFYMTSFRVDWDLTTQKRYG